MNKLQSKKIIIFLSGVVMSLLLLLPLFIQNEARAEVVDVSARVPSKISLDHSYDNLSARKTLADPVNHWVVLTVYLADKDGNPLPNLKVKVSSSRGSIDVVEVVSESSSSEQQIGETREGETGSDGKAYFKISSFTPGKVVLGVVADTIVDLPSRTVEFIALPFPANITLSIDLPFTEREVTLLSPKIQEDELSAPLKEARELTSPEGTKIEIPFWIFALLSVIVFGGITFIIFNFVNLRRVRKSEGREAEILKKIAAASNLCTLKGEVKEGEISCDDLFKVKKLERRSR